MCVTILMDNFIMKKKSLLFFDRVVFDPSKVTAIAQIWRLNLYYATTGVYTMRVLKYLPNNNNHICKYRHLFSKVD